MEKADELGVTDQSSLEPEHHASGQSESWDRFWSSCRGSAETSLTSIHEDTGSTPVKQATLREVRVHGGSASALSGSMLLALDPQSYLQDLYAKQCQLGKSKFRVINKYKQKTFH